MLSPFTTHYDQWADLYSLCTLREKEEAILMIQAQLRTRTIIPNHHGMMVGELAQARLQGLRSPPTTALHHLPAGT